MATCFFLLDLLSQRKPAKRRAAALFISGVTVTATSGSAPPPPRMMPRRGEISADGNNGDVFRVRQKIVGRIKIDPVIIEAQRTERRKPRHAKHRHRSGALAGGGQVD